MAQFFGLIRAGIAGGLPEVVRKNVRTALLVPFFLTFFISAQQYPDTLWMSVTFYDFHADKSNPEFEPTHNAGGLKTGMVSETLSVDSVPKLGKNKYFSYYVDKWFKPWKTGDSTIPIYSDQSGMFGGIDTVNYDTAFKNIEFKDSLPFIHQGNGIYQFDRSGKNGIPQFFWLDGRGFGVEPRNSGHNFSFTMKLHTFFTYKKGLRFDFAGDDDVWAFINNRLAMDLGGIHTTLKDTISLDSIAGEYGLVEGKKYPFDFFYAERHTSQSTILITTNLFAPPTNIRLYPQPGAPSDKNQPLGNIDTINAGVPFTVYAHAFDSLDWRPAWDSSVTWELVDPEGRVLLSSKSGASVTIIPKLAFGSVTLKATYTPTDPLRSPSTVSINLYIGPGKADHITLQDKPEIGDSTKETNLNVLTITKDQDSVVLYAVVRDSFGDFIRFADKAVWQSSVPIVASVRPESGKQYKGIITRSSGGLTEIRVSEPGILPATVKVTVETTNVKVDSAVTRDLDGDGYLDGIYVVFDSTVTLPGNLSGYQISQGNVPFTIESVTSSSGTLNGKQFSLKLKEITGGELQTDWTPKLSILGIEKSTSVESIQCSDGAGPVVWKASYFQGDNPSAGKAGTPDTLRVVISEKVTWVANPDPNKAFKYYQGGTSKTDPFSSMIVLNDSTVTLIFSNNFAVDAGRDSIQLIRSSDVSSEVSDTVRNLPPVNGRKALVEWGRLNITFAPSSNPFIIGNPIPPRVYNYYEQVIVQQRSNTPGGASVHSSSGVLVGIKIKGKPPKVLSDGSFGVVKIYDAVGNLINSKLRVYKAQGNDYGIYWDCTNKNRRLVGTGTYLLVFTITDVSNETKNSTIKVGVKR